MITEMTSRGLCVLALAAAASGATAGETVNWTNAAGGAFADGMNWSTGSPPTIADQARFNMFGEYSVTFDSAKTLDQIRMEAGDVTLDLDGATVVLFNPILTLLMSPSAGQSSDLTISGGTLITEDAMLAFSSLTEASITVDGPASVFTVQDELILGRSGEAGLLVSGGGTVNYTTEARIGSMAGAISNVTVTGDGSSIVGSGPLHIGEEFGASFATLHLTDSGACTAPSAIVGRNGIIQGDSTLTTTVTNNGGISPGNAAADFNELTIDGSLVQNSTSELLIEINAFDEDVLHVTGDVVLGGELRVELFFNYMPVGGESRTIMTCDGVISGSFADLTLVNGSPDLDLSIQVQGSSVNVVFIGDSGILGDVTGDGVVNALDLANVLSYWGTDNPVADLNGSGEVTAADLAIVLGNWTL